MSWITEWTDDITEMIDLFGTVVTNGGGIDMVIAAILVGIGGLLTVASITIFGILTAGAVYGLVAEPS